MPFSWQALFFIALLLFSGLFVNGLIIPSFAVPPIQPACDNCTNLKFESNSSPLKQFKDGVLLPNIFCKVGLVLVFKISDSSSACMKSETAQKLTERGWGVLNEQTVWFEFDPIECQKTPWQEWGKNLQGVQNEHGLIKKYFRNQGITIIESMSTYYATAMPPPPCGQPSGYSYYFLVPELDDNKMIDLGYKKVDNIQSNAHAVVQP